MPVADLCVAVLLLATCAAVPSPVHASAVALSGHLQTVELWPHVRILKDPQAKLTIDEVKDLEDRFTVPEGSYANLGLNRGVIWLHVPVYVPPSASGSWMFNINYAQLDQVDLYVLTEKRLSSITRMGDWIPASQRTLATRTPTAQLELEPGQHHTLLISVKTSSGFALPMKLYRFEQYYAHETVTYLVQGLVIGIWVSLALYALSQGLLLRETMFLYYAASIFFIGLYLNTLYGLAYQHLWGDNLWLAKNTPVITILTGMACSMLFLNRALNARELWRYAEPLLMGMALLQVSFAIARALDIVSFQATNNIAAVLGMSALLVAVPLAFLRYRRGDSASIFMLLGWFAYAAGGVYLVLWMYGMIDAIPWRQHALQVGWTLEMVLWMALLAARVQEMRRAAEVANQEKRVLQKLAHTDPLTGLLNRRGLHNASVVCLGGADPENLVVVYVLDLDGFKAVNDKLGHDVGDALLCQVSDRLRDSLRARDLVARLGGDEFVAVAIDVPGEREANMIGRNLLQALREPFRIEGTTCSVGATIGFAMAPHDGNELPSLLKRADAAMYAGKCAGKNQVQRGAASAELLHA